jgi:hypothetical protein
MLCAYSPLTPLNDEPDAKAEAKDNLNQRLLAFIQPPSHGSRRVEASGTMAASTSGTQATMSVISRMVNAARPCWRRGKPAPGNQGQRRGVEREGREVGCHAARAGEEGSADAGRFESVVGAVDLGGRNSARSPTAMSRAPKPMLMAALRVSLVGEAGVANQDADGADDDEDDRGTGGQGPLRARSAVPRSGCSVGAGR